jgi:hypothetical protein
MVEAVVRDVESKIANLEQGLRQLLKRTGVRALSQGLSVLDQSYPGRGTPVLVGRWPITSLGARCARDVDPGFHGQRLAGLSRLVASSRFSSLRLDGEAHRPGLSARMGQEAHRPPHG